MNVSKEIIIILIALIIAIFVYWRIRRNFKFLKVPSVCLITGGVKTGKSLLSVFLATKDFVHRHRIWYLKTKILKKQIEEPLFYTNTYINFGLFHKNLNRCIRYIDLKHLSRDVRFNYKSVIYIQECSLLCDCMDVKNQERNVDLSLYNKLIAHETKGGCVYYDTQSVLDSHYSIKRVCSTYFFIQKNINLLLFHVLYVREMINTENGVNDFTDDVDMTTRKVLVPFWYHKRYDRYYFSFLTDKLSTDYEQVKDKKDLISFNPLYVSRAYKEALKKEDIKNLDGVINPTINDLYNEGEK